MIEIKEPLKKEFVVGAFIVMDIDISALSKETIKFIKSNSIGVDSDFTLDENICECQELELQEGFELLSEKSKEEVKDISFEAFRISACYVRLIKY